jgi:hypothetical protein
LSNAIHNAADFGLNLTIYLVKHIEHNDAFCHILVGIMTRRLKTHPSTRRECHQVFGSYVDDWQTSQVRGDDE